MKITLKVLLRELKGILIFALTGFFFNLVLYEMTSYNVLVSILVWVFLAKGNGYIVDYLNKRISWVETPVTRVVVGMVAMLIYTIVAFGVLITWANWYFFDQDPVEVLLRIEPYSFVSAILITLIISMFIHGRAFYLNWKKALLREEKLKNESLRSRYESLKNQVNPHFLFNSLNVLSNLVYDDQEKAVAFIRKMADVYRYVLEKKDQELVDLEEELKFVKSYVYLQKIRFGENFDLKISTEGAKGFVPPLAVQLLVENAIKHNIVSEARPLSVRVIISDGEITVENNIQEKRSKDSTGIGLSNLKARYDFLSDKPMVVHNDQKQFKVILPILQMQK